MPDIAFTDEELAFLQSILPLADPLRAMSQAQSILAKIQVYAREKQEMQVAEAARESAS